MSSTALSHTQEWWQSLWPRSAPPPSRRAALLALRLLAYLRLFAPIAQGLTLLIVTEQFRVQLPLTGVVTLLAVELAVAAATFVRLRRVQEISPAELFAHALLDIVLYTFMLYMTGGSENPFAPLLVVPIVIVASALKPRWVWVLAATTIAAYVGLRSHKVELSHPQGHTHVYELHEDGMVINYLITAALLAFFCNGMHAASRRNERMLADARDAQMRNESVVAIGALAAGYAHELSSPLSTVAVLTAELKRQYAGDAQLQGDLQLVADQVAECKRIVSNLASAGGERRAETAGAARIDRFLASAIERARALQPGATIIATVDGTRPPPMIVTEETLRQTIVNLIQNAGHASPHAVRVAAAWDREELRVEVRDRGPGFPDEVLARLGRNVKSTRGAEGMGLGLMLSMMTLERLGGRLEICNEAEGGARASIRIPMRSIEIEAERQFLHGSTTD